MMQASFEPGGLSNWRFRSSAASHPGAVRAHNEDSFVNRPDLGLWAVADGAGGHAMLVSTIVVLLARDDYYACLWAGDSRAYLLRGGCLRQLTRDHSLVQELFDAGAISAAEAVHHPSANIITHAIGADTLELDKVTDRLLPGDRFLLCSDGLFKTLPEPELARIMGADDDPPAQQLLRAALNHQPDDNVTVVAVEASHAPDWRDAADRTELSTEDAPTRRHWGLG